MRPAIPALLIVTATFAGSLVPVHARTANLGIPPSPSSITAGGVQDYPRIASLYSFSSSTQVSALARYGQIVGVLSDASNGALQALKAQSPATRATFYVDTSAVDVPGFDGLSIYPGWWLTLAGTTLAAPLDASSTSVQVANAAIISANLSTSPDLLVDGESMHVLSVNAAANTLSVQRGYNSIATAHNAGARIAAHASNWPGAWMLNLTPYCPTNPATGQTWAGYLAQQVKNDLAAAPWDGVFYDNANASWATLLNGQLDANNDNVADGGNGPSGTGWSAGEIGLFAQTRLLAPAATIESNGGYYAGASNGQEMEHFPYYANGWSSALSSYLQVAGPTVPGATSIINADTNNTGSQDLQSMRFNLGTALLGNGYYAYDYGTQNHGQTWWYDEYDNGAGSSLSASIGATQTIVPLAAGSGVKFKVGDVVRVPDGGNGHDDEQMLVIAISGDVLAVQRGYNGSAPATHDQLAKVFTQVQLAAGQGWLGQPLGPATSLSSGGASTLANNGFEQAAMNQLSGWQFSAGGPVSIAVSQDSSTAQTGLASARVAVYRAAPGASWDATLTQGAQSITAGASYTFSFWAKGTAGESIGASVQQDAAPWTGFTSQTFGLTGSWQQYSASFTAPATISPVRIQFNLAQAAGTIWIDNTTFQQGNPNIWRRDFTHGTVLVNGTGTPQTVTLPAGYRRIAGTQSPAINNGAPVTSVTLAPQDAILLVKVG
jgi:Carbohydrate binding domain/Hypothetical glycosyl hydrolase family 15